MSAISEKVRKAFFAKSSPAMTGVGKLTAIYNDKAPKTAVRPYGIFARQAPGAVTYTFGPRLALEDDLYRCRVFTDEDSIPVGKEPQEFAEEMAILWETTLGTDLTIAGNTVTWFAKFSDIPPIEEKQGDRYIYSRGFLWRIAAE